MSKQGTGKRRRIQFEDVLDLEQFGLMEDDEKDKLVRSLWENIIDDKTKPLHDKILELNNLLKQEKDLRTSLKQTFADNLEMAEEEFLKRVRQEAQESQKVLGDLEQQLKTKQDALNIAQGEMLKLRNKKKAASTNNGGDAKKDAEIASLLEENKKLRENNKKLRDTNQRLKATVTRPLANTPGNIAQLQNQIKGLQGKNMELRGVRDGLEKKVGELEEEVKELLDEQKLIGKKATDCENCLHELDRQKKQEIKELEDKIKEIKGVLTRVRSERNTLRGHLANGEHTDDTVRIVEAMARRENQKVVDQLNMERNMAHDVLRQSILTLAKTGHGHQASRFILGKALRNTFSGSENPNAPIAKWVKDTYAPCFSFKPDQCNWNKIMYTFPAEDYAETMLWEDTRYWKALHCEKSLRSDEFHFRNRFAFRKRLLKFIKEETGDNAGQGMPSGTTPGQAADAIYGILCMEAAGEKNKSHKGKMINP